MEPIVILSSIDAPSRSLKTRSMHLLEDPDSEDDCQVLTVTDASPGKGKSPVSHKVARDRPINRNVTVISDSPASSIATQKLSDLGWNKRLYERLPKTMKGHLIHGSSTSLDYENPPQSQDVFTHVRRPDEVSNQSAFSSGPILSLVTERPHLKRQVNIDDICQIISGWVDHQVERRKPVNQKDIRVISEWFISSAAAKNCGAEGIDRVMTALRYWRRAIIQAVGYPISCSTYEDFGLWETFHQVREEAQAAISQHFFLHSSVLSL